MMCFSAFSLVLFHVVVSLLIKTVISTQTRRKHSAADLGPLRQRGGQTDRKRESGRVYLRTDGELGQSAAQPLRDCLQLFQLRLLTPALLAQDLVLQPLVTLSKTQHTCSKTRPAHGAAPQLRVARARF